MTAPLGARSGSEIQADLRTLAARWHDYDGREIAEAQTFLNELLDCDGVARRAAGVQYEYALPGGKRMDMFWPGRALVEMKAPSRSQRLEEAQPQAESSMEVLQSSAHIAWAWFRSSTLETRLRYTPTTVFSTSPWPDRATAAMREAVAEACRRMLARRTEICVGENIGITTLYNALDDGAWADLRQLHRALDESVVACYGWAKAVAHDNAELVRRLSELNREIAIGERPYEPFARLEPSVD